MKLGIDIGGTHTDGVLVNAKNEIINYAKVVTTRPLERGFCALLQKLCSPACRLERICVGTTHATNALLEQKNLAKVGLLRLQANGCLIPPCFGWSFSPIAGFVTLPCGSECCGESAGPISRSEVSAAVESLLAMGAETLAVVGTFSPMFPEQEEQVSCLIAEQFGRELSVTLSHKLGSLGILERENSTILNASLVPEMKRGFARLQQSLDALHIHAPLYLTDNRGSLLSLEEAIAYPIKTLASGPTNSFIGAAKLMGVASAVVIDVGGTSTDVGVVCSGYPRRSFMKSSFGGISLSFPMPDTLSVALGGGSIIETKGASFSLGPRSLGARLFTEGLSFGGNLVTLCDAALTLGHTHIAGARSGVLDPSFARLVITRATETLEKLSSQMRARGEELPWILVGGGASLFACEKFSIPPFSQVANAFGAALAEVSAELDCVVSLEERDHTLNRLKEEVLAEVALKGGNPHKSRIVDLQLFPYSYVKGHKARVLLTAAAPLCGDLQK